MQSVYVLLKQYRFRLWDNYNITDVTEMLHEICNSFVTAPVIQWVRTGEKSMFYTVLHST